MTEASPVLKTALTTVSSPQAPYRQRRPQGFTEGRYSWLRSRGLLDFPVPQGWRCSILGEGMSEEVNLKV